MKVLNCRKISPSGIEESDPCEATQAYGIDDDQVGSWFIYYKRATWVLSLTNGTILVLE